MTAADCERQVSQATMLNGPDLLVGAWICFSANRGVEGGFLLNAGQTRSIVDLALTVPATRADSEIQAAIYGFIYFRAGGPGREDILRDEASRNRFLQMLDDWSPQFSETYNPGWNVRRRPDASAYRAAIEEEKVRRRRQLVEVARLYSDDAYFALHRRFGELQARNPRGFVEGTPDDELSRELSRQMNLRALALGLRTARDTSDLDDASSPRFPPHEPGADEEILPSSTDPVVQHCVDLAERMTIASDSRVARVLITRSSEWGVIWRADLEGSDMGSERLTCSANTTSSRPLEADDNIPRLPEGANVRR
jgi:hypothetical protein